MLPILTPSFPAKSPAADVEKPEAAFVVTALLEDDHHRVARMALEETMQPYLLGNSRPTLVQQMRAITQMTRDRSALINKLFSTTPYAETRSANSLQQMIHCPPAGVTARRRGQQRRWWCLRRELCPACWARLHTRNIMARLYCVVAEVDRAAFCLVGRQSRVYLSNKAWTAPRAWARARELRQRFGEDMASCGIARMAFVAPARSGWYVHARALALVPIEKLEPVLEVPDRNKAISQQVCWLDEHDQAVSHEATLAAGAKLVQHPPTLLTSPVNRLWLFLSDYPSGVQLISYSGKMRNAFAS